MKAVPKLFFGKTLPCLSLLLAALSMPAATVRYVNVGSTHPVPPFTNWAAAATTIQDAVDAAEAGDEIVVTNGVYATGGRAVFGLMTNRVAVTKPLKVQSVNGPRFTIIQGWQVPGTRNGDGAIRCAYLTNGAMLSGFTLTNGATRSSGDFDKEIWGGGVWCESAKAIVNNCKLIGNSATIGGGGAYSGTLTNCTISDNAVTGYFGDSYGGGAIYATLNNCTLLGNSANMGGGAYGATLNNCALTGNSALGDGGAVYRGTLNNCTLTGNSAISGGSVAYSTLKNCILFDNAAADGPDYNSSTLDGCCTTPLPTSGLGNFTNAPLFVAHLSGNLRLQSNSPCINSGYNAHSPAPTDLDGRPRIAGDRVDIGAYEYQGAGMSEFIGWLQQYGLATDGSADFADPDGERLNNWQEWNCGTVPTNALSALRLLKPSVAGTNLSVRWESVSGKRYSLERSTGLRTNASFLTLATNLLGQAGTTTFTDTNAAASGLRFYRVGMQ